MSVDVGSKAPDFTLDEPGPAAGHAQRSSAASRSCWRSFPAAFSSVCKGALHVPRLVARLNEAKAQVFGISVDTFFTLKAFHDQQKLTFPLLSDFNKQVIRDYGVFNEDMIGLKGIAKRAVFVHRQGRRRPAPRGARGRAERAGLREGVRGARSLTLSAGTGADPGLG